MDEDTNQPEDVLEFEKKRKEIDEKYSGLDAVEDKILAPLPNATPLPEHAYGPEVGVIGEFGRGVKSGIYNTKATIESLAGMAAGTGLLGEGYEQAAPTVLTNASQTYDYASDVGPKIASYKDVEGVGTGVSYAAGLLGSFLPDLLPGLVTGGVGGAFARRAATNMAEKAVADMAKTQVLKNVPDLLANQVSQRAVAEAVEEALKDPVKRALIREQGDKAAKMAFAGIMTGDNVSRQTGQTYQSVYDETGVMDAGLALQHGAIAGAMDSISEIIFGGKIVGLANRLPTSGPKEFLKGVGKEAIKGAAIEAPTETAQQLIQTGASFRANPDREWTTADTDALYESAIAGGVLGSILGGGAQAVARKPKTVTEVISGKESTPTIDVEEETTQPEKAPTVSWEDFKARKQETVEKVETVAGVGDVVENAKRVEEETGAPTFASRTALENITKVSVEGDIDKTISEREEPEVVDNSDVPTDELDSFDAGNKVTDWSEALLADVEEVQVPVDNVEVNVDIPQFKKDADKSTGVVDEITSSFSTLGTGPIIIWEKLDGRQEVATGRHRLNRAKKDGHRTIKAQVLREADGYDREAMMTLDAVLNIREGAGSVSDYAQFIRNSAITREQAKSQGLFRQPKGVAGFEIGKGAGDDLYAAVQNGKIDETKAAIIAKNAPLNDNVQRAAMRSASLNQAELSGLVSYLNQNSVEGSEVDMFGSDDTALNQAVELSKLAAGKVDQLNKRIASASGAARRPEDAKGLGVDVKDIETTEKQITDLKEKRDKLKEFWLHKDLVDELSSEVKPVAPDNYRASRKAYLSTDDGNHSSIIERAVRKVAALFPARKLRFVKSADLPKGADAAIGNLSTGKAKALGITENLPAQHVLGTLPDKFAGVSNEKQFNERMEKVLPDIRADIRAGKHINTKLNVAQYEKQLGRTLSESEQAQMLADMQKKQTDIQTGWVDYLENGGYTSEVQALILNSITKEIATPTEKGWKFQSLGKDADRLAEPASPTLAAKVAQALTQPENKQKKIAQIIAESAKAAEEESRSSRDQVKSSTEEGGELTWVKFPSKGNDPENFDKNVQDLTALAKTSSKFGKCDWCTGNGAAQGQLETGDFWIGVDENGNARTAVRMDGSDQIGEIRGVLEGQNLEPKYAGNVTQLVKKEGWGGGDEFLRDAKLQGALQQFESGDIPWNELKSVMPEGEPGDTSDASFVEDLLDYQTQGYGGTNHLVLGKKAWAELAKVKDGKFSARELRLIAENKSATGDLLEIVEESVMDPEMPMRDITSTRVRVASHTNVNAKTLNLLANAPTDVVRDAVARNENTPPETLTKLSGDKEQSVRWMAAANKSTPVSAIEALISKETDPEVIRKASSNPNLSPEFLDKIERESKRKDEVGFNTRVGVAKNTSTSPETLRRMAKEEMSGYPDVLALGSDIAGNPNTPDDALINVIKQPWFKKSELVGKILTRGENSPSVHEALVSKSELWEDLVDWPQSLPESTLRTIAKDDSEENYVPRALSLNALDDRNLDTNRYFQSLSPSSQLEAYFDPATNEHVFVTDNIESPDRAARLFFHEATHGNIALAEGDAKSREELNNILQAARPMLDKEIPNILKDSGFNSIEELADAYKYDLTTNEGQNKLTGELVSRFAERIADNPNPPAWWKRALSSIKLWLAENFGINLSAGDLEQFLRSKMEAYNDLNRLVGPAEILPSIRKEVSNKAKEEAKKMDVDTLITAERKLSDATTRDARMNDLLQAVRSEIAQRSYRADRVVDGKVTIDRDWALRAALNKDGALDDNIFGATLRSRLENDTAELVVGSNRIPVRYVYGNEIFLGNGKEIQIGDFLTSDAKIEITKSSNPDSPAGSIPPADIPSLKDLKYTTAPEPTPTKLDKAKAMIVKPFFGDINDPYNSGGWFTTGDLTPESRDARNKKNNRMAGDLNRARFEQKALEELLQKNFGGDRTVELYRNLSTAMGLILSDVSTNQRAAIAKMVEKIKMESQAKWVRDNIDESDLVGSTAEGILTELGKLDTISQRQEYLRDALGSDDFNSMLKYADEAAESAYTAGIAATRNANTKKALEAKAAARKLLPPEVVDALDKMKATLDSLNAQAALIGLKDDNSFAAFKTDSGLVFGTTYRIFSDPNFRAKVSEGDVDDKMALWIQNELINSKARELLAADRSAARKAKTKPLLTDKQARHDAATLVTSNDVADFATKVISASSEEDFLKTLKNTFGSEVSELGVPEEIKNVWGLFVDPKVDYMRKVSQMSRAIATKEMSDSIKAEGLASGWLKMEGEVIPKGYDKVPEFKGGALKELQGYYAPVKFIKYFKEYYDRSELGPVHAFFSKVALGTTLSKTTMSVPGAVRNLLSGVFPTMFSGNYDPNTMRDGYIAAMTNLLGKGDETSRDYVEKLTRLGITNDNLGPKFIKEMMADGNFSSDEELRAFLDSALTDKWEAFKDAPGKVTAEKSKKLLDTLAKAYAAPDDFWKAAIFENERNRIKKYEDHMVSKDPSFKRSTESEIDVEAAAQTRNVYPSYDMAAEGIKALKVLPMLGQFATWSSENIRTTVNAVKRNIEDVRSGNDYKERRGWFGLINQAAILSAPIALGAFTKALFGVTEEEEEAIRDNLPPWQRNSQMVYLGRDPITGNILYWDSTFLDTLAYFKKPVVGAVSAAVKGDMGLFDNPASEFLREAFEPFLGVDIATSKFLEIQANKSASGSRIYNPEDPNKYWDQAAYFLKGVQPGTLTMITNSIKNSEEMGVLGAIAGSLLGNPRISDPRKDLGFTSYKTAQRLRDANALLISAARKGEDVEAAYEATNEARKRIIEDAYTAYQNSITRGVSEEEINETFKGAQLSKAMVAQIKGGYIDPYVPAKRTKKFMKEGSAETIEELQASKERIYLEVE